mmetsp:Transcript_6729/g.16706  ORF Transcript_6729/g.16706 Transcript_6729/m.16706 type:complete len:161 (+) Transcript_6729:3-485(+)
MAQAAVGKGCASRVAMDRPLRSKGLLPAVGVGATVYFVTGAVTLSTLGLVGIGAGVGYGVGSWLADKYQDRKGKDDGAGRQGMDQLPWALQVSLQQWKAYLSSRVAGTHPTPQQVEAIFEEWAQLEPAHAQNVRAFVAAAGSSNAASGASSASVTSVANV